MYLMILNQDYRHLFESLTALKTIAERRKYSESAQSKYFFNLTLPFKATIFDCYKKLKLSIR